MSWYYREGVHAAAAGRDLVLLDLTADAYSCIPEAGSLGSQFDIHIDRLDDGAQALLRDAGLIVSQQPSSVGSTLPQKATRDLVVDLLAPLPVRDVLGVLAARAELRRAGPDPTVSDLLAAVGPRSETSPDRDLIFRPLQCRRPADAMDARSRPLPSAIRPASPCSRSPWPVHRLGLRRENLALSRPLLASVRRRLSD